MVSLANPVQFLKDRLLGNLGICARLREEWLANTYMNFYPLLFSLFTIGILCQGFARHLTSEPPLPPNDL